MARQQWPKDDRLSHFVSDLALKAHVLGKDPTTNTTMNWLSLEIFLPRGSQLSKGEEVSC